MLLFWLPRRAPAKLQSPPTFMVIRGCIENALYSFIVSQDNADGDVWLRRAEDPAAMKAKFTANRAIQKMELVDPNLATMVRESYQWTIEFGAHPNPRGVLDHIRPKQPDPGGDVPFTLVYVQSAGSVGHIRALSACIENACMVIAIITHALRKHPRASQAFDRTWKLFHQYQKFIEDEGYFTPSKESFA